MAKNRYFYYDSDAATFVEVRPKASRTLPGSAPVAFASVVLAVSLLFAFRGRMEAAYDVSLEAENRALQQQLVATEERIDQFAARLDQLAESDQSLYRVLLDAEPVPHTVLRTGIDARSAEAFGQFRPATARLLREAAVDMSRLERQINVQRASYNELNRLAEKREAELAEMPAILPADGPVISGYGVRRHPILRISRMHTGIDIVVRTGSSVVTTGDGVVREAAFSPTYGNYVRVEHPTAGYSTLYAHLSAIPRGVRPGLKVRRGDQIGLSGSTGRSAGPHVHYEVLDANGRALNPVHFFAPSMTPAQYRLLLQAADEAHIALD